MDGMARGAVLAIVVVPFIWPFCPGFRHGAGWSRGGWEPPRRFPATLPEGGEERRTTLAAPRTLYLGWSSGLSGETVTKRILITGAGTGFGRDAALGLAAKGHEVIAAVQFPEQVAELTGAAGGLGLELRVAKLDLLSEADRRAAESWDVDVLVNNAAIGEGGPIAEIPLDLVRDVFEVNVFATLELTQRLVRQMVRRGRGRVIFVSSIAGLTAGAYLGAYAASKHALEAIAEAMSKELLSLGVQVVTLNPGPYATGFNDRMVRSLERWYDPARNFTHPEDLASLAARFARQFDPDGLVQEMIALAESDSGRFRNVHPRESEALVHERESQAWTREIGPPETTADLQQRS